MNSVVEGVVANLDKMVRPDDGKVTLLDVHSDNPHAVHVRYEMASSADCESCAITPELLEAFLREALTAHGVEASEVVVEAVPR